LIRIQEGFNEIISFLRSLLEFLGDNDRVLDKFEVSIILPTILECVGRNEARWSESRALLLRICDDAD
jgi:hypothetical protein